MDQKTRTRTQPHRTFQWGISSTDIPFVQKREAAAARDTSANDCSSYVSPLPQPKRGRTDPGQVPK